jgi:hypothetical protein
VDIRSDAVKAIMQSRLDLAVSKGCDGVEPDNVDEYTNKNGLGITAADQIAFNTFVATEVIIFFFLSLFFALILFVNTNATLRRANAVSLLD